MCFQIGCIDHDDLLLAALGGQPLHHPGEDAHVAPPLPAIVEGLGRAILPRRVAPSQPIAIYEDYAAQDPSIIDPRLAMALRKKRLQPLHLLVRQPEKVAHHNPRQFGSLNHAGRAASSRSMGPSLFGGFGSSIFELYPSRWRLMSIAGSRFSSGSAQRPSHHGIRRVGRSNLTRVLTADLLSTLDPLRTRLTRRPAKDIFPPAVDLFSFQVSIKSRLHPRATSGIRCRRSTFCA